MMINEPVYMMGNMSILRSQLFGTIITIILKLDWLRLMGCRCGGGAEHEHTEDLDAASAKSLYQYIDMSQTQALNTKADTRLEQVLRPRYHGPKAYLESDTDPQVLIKIQ